jgi:hypothetical protein
MKGRKIYIVADAGKLEAFTNMTKLCESFPVFAYDSLRRNLRKKNFYVRGRYEVWRVIIQ